MSFQHAAVPPPALRGRCVGHRDAYGDSPFRVSADVGDAGSPPSSVSTCRPDCRQIDRILTTPAGAMDGNDKAVSAASGFGAVDSCVNARVRG
jgi:hypothetical protein